MSAATDAALWLEQHAIRCDRHHARWDRQMCHDLAFTSLLCHGCSRAPQKPAPSVGAKSLAAKLDLNHPEAMALGRVPRQGYRPSPVTMERTKPWTTC